MKEIHLTNGMVAVVDDEDFEYINQFKWYAQVSNRSNKYYAAIKFPKFIYMHRLIMKTPKGVLCDHINGNSLDNRKSNLRNCNFSENNYNKGAQKNNKLNKKNIFKTANNTFRVCIKANKKYVLNKCFNTLREAIKMRDIYLEKHHKEFKNTGE